MRLANLARVREYGVTGSDGKIYYVLSSESYDVAVQMYCFDPATKKIRHLGDLTEACGAKGMKAKSDGDIPTCSAGISADLGHRPIAGPILPGLGGPRAASESGSKPRGENTD